MQAPVAVGARRRDADPDGAIRRQHRPGRARRAAISLTETALKELRAAG